MEGDPVFLHLPVSVLILGEISLFLDKDIVKLLWNFFF
jgi:hypothetical protein